MKKRIPLIALFLAVSLALSCLPAPLEASAAVSQSQIDALRQKTKDIGRQKGQLQAQLDALKADKASAITQKAVYDRQLAALDEDIETVEALLTGLAEEVAAKTLSLEAAILQENESRAQYEARVAAMQRMGETSYWGALLAAENFSDFLARWEAVRRIMDYDKALAGAFRKARADLEAEREALEADLREQEESREHLVAAKAELAGLAREADELIAGVLTQEEEVLQEYREQSAAELAAEREREALEAEMQREIEAELLRQAEERRRQAERQEEERRRQATPTPAETAEGEEDGEDEEKSAPAPQDAIDSSDPYIGGGYIWPVPGHTTVTSAFGWRIHPVYGTRKFHNGIDIRAPKGAKVVASGAGTVLMRTYNGAYGNCVVLYHGGGQTTLYAHLNGFGSYQVGDTVKKGDVIGYVGTTGVSTGYHLHFEVIINGEKKNPRNFV